jgi:hypothetical protein
MQSCCHTGFRCWVIHADVVMSSMLLQQLQAPWLSTIPVHQCHSPYPSFHSHSCWSSPSHPLAHQGPLMVAQSGVLGLGIECCYSIKAAVQCQNNVKQVPVKNTVSKQQTMPLALSLYAHVKDLPV